MTQLTIQMVVGDKFSYEEIIARPNANLAINWIEIKESKKSKEIKEEDDNNTLIEIISPCKNKALKLMSQ